MNPPIGGSSLYASSLPIRPAVPVSAGLPCCCGALARCLDPARNAARVTTPGIAEAGFEGPFFARDRAARPEACQNGCRRDPAAAQEHRPAGPYGQLPEVHGIPREAIGADLEEVLRSEA
jgi:hypothetical protein